MKKTMFLSSAAMLFATLAFGGFENSPLFEKFVDPYSGVESYLLKPKAFAFSQQSIYFTNKSVTDDGRYLIFWAMNSATDLRKRLVVADLESNAFTELKDVPVKNQGCLIP